MSATLRLYGAIEKIDELGDGTINVHGIASSEAQDDQGEIVRAAAMEAAIPDYMKFGAVREMHQPLAAGRAIEAGVGPDRITRLVAHVVDPVAISKVRNRVYNGFSIGGRVIERDPADRRIITALQLNEISLVDRPANPEAVFDCWKRGGVAAEAAADIVIPREEVGPVQRFFAKLGIGGAAPTAKGGDEPGDGSKPYGDVEYADPGLQSDGKKRYPIDTEAHIRAAWNYISKPKNAGKYTAEQLAQIKAKIAAAWKDKIDGAGPPSAADKNKAAAARAADLHKTLGDVGEVAWLLLALARMRRNLEFEAALEGDDSPQPARLAGIIKELSDFLNALAAEETAELLAGDDEASMPPSGPIGPIIGLAASGGEMTVIDALLDALGKRHGGHQHLMDMAHAGMRKLLDDDGDGYTREGDQHLKDAVHAACGKCMKMDGLSEAEHGHMAAAHEWMKVAGAGAGEGGGADEHATTDTGHNAEHPAPTTGGADPTAKAARHSRDVAAALHKAHVHLCAAGAKCDCGGGGMPDEHQGATSSAGGKTAAAGADDLHKAVGDQLGAALAPLAERIAALAADVAAIKAQPLPPATVAALPPGLVRIEKGGAAADPAVADIATALAKMSEEDRAMALIRMTRLVPSVELTQRYGGTMPDLAAASRAAG